MKAGKTRIRILGLLVVFFSALTLFIPLFTYGFRAVGTLGLIELLAMIAIGFFLCRAKKDAAAFLAVSVYFTFELILNLIHGGNALVIIADLIVIAFSLLNWFAADKVKKLNMFWFAAPIVYAIAGVINIVRIIDYYPGEVGVLVSILSAVACLITVYACARMVTAAIVGSAEEQAADSKQYYKGLLDRGVITQSEYDEKISKL